MPPKSPSLLEIGFQFKDLGGYRYSINNNYIPPSRSYPFPYQSSYKIVQKQNLIMKYCIKGLGVGSFFEYWMGGCTQDNGKLWALFQLDGKDSF